MYSTPVKLEGGCQAHRVGYFGSAMICKKLLPEIESKQGGVKNVFFLEKCICYQSFKILWSCSHIKLFKLMHLKQFFLIIDFFGEAYFTDTNVHFPKNNNCAFSLTTKFALRLLANFNLLSHVNLIWLQIFSSNTKLFLFSLIFFLQLYRKPMLVTDPPQMEHYPHAKSTTQQPNALIETKSPLNAILKYFLILNVLIMWNKNAFFLCVSL